ncbi:MAG: phenylalanine--tRNA ligase subunit beta [Chitinophagales bacterium]|nr:phenylalanine--tRNA ligase subunit beta [Chitinophagales bacterium]
MKISYNWLKDYLDFNATAEEVGDMLTSVGLEVEGIEKWESVKGGLEGLKIGLVKSVEKHADADKLSVTKVNVGGNEDLQIVCGAPNVSAGQKVIVATDGVIIHPLVGESFKIKKTKIRGAESNGMICAQDEIGLGNDHAGIMVLNENAVVGSLAKDYFNVTSDYIFEIGLTPNRGDAMNHIGVARDLAAYLKSNKNENKSLKIPYTKSFSVHDHDLPIEVVVENAEACIRYSAVTISNITVKESPDWLKQKLNSIGLKPINNIVDITNFVMWECGQPLHAFDADEIAGRKVIVKTVSDGTVFKTLDEKEIKLAANDLMICNAEAGMCIAGVYGGINSGVKNSTQNIFLESACFHPTFIRRTSTRHKLRTDAATHFEKGTDPNGTLYALQRAALLICELGGGKISSEVIDVYPLKVSEKIISLTWEKLNRIAGTAIPVEDAKNIVEALQFKIIDVDEKQITVASPTYKTDVSLPEDLIEEILRIYGFEKIPVPASVHSSISYAVDDKKELLQEQIATMIAGSGFHEVINNSISNSKYHEDYFPELKDSLVKLLSFSNVGLDSMRTTMLFPALEVIRHNHNRKIVDLKLFEFGKTYLRSSEKYLEQSNLILLVTGNKQSESWQGKEQAVDFYFLKGMVEMILKKCGITRFTSTELNNAIWQQGLSYSLGKNELVSFGMVQQKMVAEFDIKKEVYYAAFDFDMLTKVASRYNNYKEPSKFPAVRRDLALVIDKRISFDEIETLALKQTKNLLQKVNLFDVYEDEKLGEGKKSYAVSFHFNDETKTLTEKEVESAMQKLVSTFEKDLGAVIRS